MALAKLMCTHCLMIGQCPGRVVRFIGTNIFDALIHLQSHEKTFAFNVGETEINASWIAIDVTIPDDVLHLRVDIFYETVRQLRDVSMISLETA